MDTSKHSLETLFKQLGLDGSPEGVRSFIDRHKPIEPDTLLWEAPCWNRGQAAFLKEAICDDAEWAEAADQLNTLLRM